MADVTLSAEIRASIDGFEKNINTAVNTVRTGSRQIDVAAGAAAKSIKGINPASNQAAFALTNLGRVAQDAPFGFIGIQNNINPLLESFQRLRQESGSTGGALKALAGSLMGAGGLGLAISLVTSALTIYTMWQQKASNETKDAKKANDEFISSAAQDTAKLSTLYNASQNVNLSYSDRKIAIDKLQKEYPDYFKNLSDEAILAGKAQTAYESLTRVMIGRAAIAAATEQLQNALKPLVDDAVKMASLNPKPKVPFSKVIKDIQDEANKEKGLIIPIDSFKFKPNALSRDNTQPILSEAQKQADASDKIRSLQEANVKKWQDTIQALIEQFGAKVLGGDGGNGKAVSGFEIIRKQISQIELALENAVLDNNNPSAIDRLAVSLTKAQQKLEQLQKTYDNSLLAGKGSEVLSVSGLTAKDIKITPPKDGFRGIVDTPEAMNNAVKAFKEYTDAKQKAYKAQEKSNAALEREKEIGQEVANVFGSGLTNAFQSALQGTQSFVSAMGQFLVQLVTRLLAAAAAAAVLAVILSAVGFGGGIGAATSSVGSFKNLFGSFSGIKLAEGGVVSKPTIAMIGEGGEPEAVIPLSKLDGMMGGKQSQAINGRVEFEIRGDKLIGVLNRAQKTKTRTS